MRVNGTTSPWERRSLTAAHASATLSGVSRTTVNGLTRGDRGSAQGTAPPGRRAEQLAGARG